MWQNVCSRSFLTEDEVLMG